MRLKDQITSQLGDRIRQSMGASEVVAVSPGTSSKPASRTEGLKALRTAAMIPIDRLTADPDQPRRTFPDEEIDQLADSLRARGMLMPIRARWDTDLDRWVVVAGERRLRAARRAGWTEVPCITVEGVMSPGDVRMDQLIENLHRSDLPPLEQAAAFRELLDRHGWSARRLAEELSLSHQTVSRALALLELPAEIQEQVRRGELAPRTAAELASVEKPEQQVAIAERAVSERLSRDQVVQAVRRPKGRGRTRVIKLTTGRVTVELKKGGGAEAIAMLLREVLARIEAELAESAAA
jgi:ParB family chromosome partitioning protein